MPAIRKLFSAIALTTLSVAIHAESIIETSEALLKQGRQYEFGEGVTRDHNKALNSFCKAAALGNAEAGYELGWYYANGRGERRDEHLAKLWLSWSAQQGDATAEALLPYFGGTRSKADIDCSAEQGQRITLRSGSHNDTLASVDDTTNSAEIINFVHAWAQNWAAGDTQQYLANYADNFQPARSLNLQQWRIQRRQRVQPSHAIQLNIEQLQVTNSAPMQARASFIQNYSAANYQDRVHKTLNLKHQDGRWQIQSEHVRTTLATH